MFGKISFGFGITFRKHETDFGIESHGMPRNLNVDYRLGVLIVLLSGVFFSMTGLAIRFIEEARVWQILFYRSLGLIPVLYLFITFRSDGAPIAEIRKAGFPAVIGGAGLVGAFSGGVYSIQETTVANAVFLFATAPFFTAVFAWPVLGERVRRRTWIAIGFGIVGVITMVSEGVAKGALLGNLAAVVAQMARDKSGPDIAFQLLVYPVTDGMNFNTASYRENGQDYMLTSESMHWFWNHYAPNAEDRRNPYASPLLAGDLGSLPPALVMTAEYDPLRDEGEAYAEKLRVAGVAAECVRWDGLIHGFFGQTRTIGAARQPMARACAALRAALSDG